MRHVPIACTLGIIEKCFRIYIRYTVGIIYSTLLLRARHGGADGWVIGIYLQVGTVHQRRSNPQSERGDQEGVVLSCPLSGSESCDCFDSYRSRLVQNCVVRE